MLRFILAQLILIGLTGQASAQIYKCRDGKGGITYSDAPCPASTKHGAIDLLPAQLPPGQSLQGETESPMARQLDAAIKGALANGDIARAQGLAVNAKHWDWIVAAKRDAQGRQVIGRTDADLAAEKGGSQACQQAKRALEFEAGAYKQNEHAIEAKKSMMREACGLKEPNEVRISNRTTVIENRGR